MTSDIRTPGKRWRAKYTAEGAYIMRSAKDTYLTVFESGRRVRLTAVGDETARTFVLLEDWIEQGE